LPTIGEQNSEEALRVSKEMQLNVKATDFGGNLGRRFIVDCATGLIEIQKIAQIWDKI
jgi:chemotaxis receptor (MCP) glutamine deamidase CheD